MRRLLRATDEPQVQPLLQTASSTGEEEMTLNLAARGLSLPARPAPLESRQQTLSEEACRALLFGSALKLKAD